MKSFTRILVVLLTLLVLMLARSLRSSAPRHTGSVEQTRTLGLAYGTLRVSLPGRTGRLHVVTMDPNRVEVRVLKASDFGLDVASVESIARKTGAQAVINGGFFDEHNKPLGLIVTDHKKRNPLRAVDWGVFLIRQGKPAILHTRDYRPGLESYALQCGPRLVVSGKVTSLKPRKSYRAAVGITGGGEIVFVVTEDIMLELSEFAGILARCREQGGVGCVDALNLDGGPSAQLYLNAPPARFSLAGGWGVPTAIAAFARPATR